MKAQSLSHAAWDCKYHICLDTEVSEEKSL